MKHLLFAAATLVAATGQGFAADPVVPDPIIPAPVAAGYDWSGPYVGGHIGYSWPGIKRGLFIGRGIGNLAAGFDDGFDANGFVGGIHLGANFQRGAWVFGLEGDIEYSGMEGEDDGLGMSETVGIDWMGSVRGRAGYALDRLLIYGTAGLAFAAAEADVAGFVSDSQTHVGWTAGAGAEYAVTDNWTTRLEYRYADLGDQDYALEPVIAGANYAIKVHTVRLGLTYKF